MASTQIVCTNCGAKYRIPETFKGSRAKCKACGTVIDVAAQRDAEATAEPAAPVAAAKPAVAKPAVAKSERAKAARSRPRRSAKKEEAASETSSSSDSGPGKSRSSRSRSSGSSGSRRSRARPEKKSGNKGMLIGGGLFVVALAIVGVIFMTGGDTGSNPEDEAAKVAAAEDAAKAKQEVSDQETAAEKLARVQEAAAAELAAKETAAVEAAAKKDAEAAKEASSKRKKGEPITEASQVYNPKTALEPTPWPEDASEAEITEITALVDSLANGGRAAIDAKKKLATMGHKVLPAIVNALRDIDYLESFEVMTAWELNKFMEQITVGTNVGFRPCNIGETVPLDDAHWNARIVSTWRKFAIRFNNADEWEKMLARNKGK